MYTIYKKIIFFSFSNIFLEPNKFFFFHGIYIFLFCTKQIKRKINLEKYMK